MKIFSYLRAHKVFFTTLIFISILTTSFSVETKSANAVAGFNPGGLPVGGTITSMTACTCGYTAWLAAMYIVVVGKDYTKSGPYAFSGTLTEIHSNWMIRPGAGMLGTYIPGIQACWMQAAFACFPLPNRGLITSIGTGLAP